MSKIKVLKPDGGKRKVKAIEVFGTLAVHHSTSDALELTISYLPSGHAVTHFSVAVPLKIIKPILKELAKLMKHYENMTAEMKKRANVRVKALAGISAAYASLMA